MPGALWPDFCFRDNYGNFWQTSNTSQHQPIAPNILKPSSGGFLMSPLKPHAI